MNLEKELLKRRRQPITITLNPIVISELDKVSDNRSRSAEYVIEKGLELLKNKKKK